MKEEILHKQIEDQFNSLFTTPPEVPSYIRNNLNHDLRPYQQQALSQFIFTQEIDDADEKFNHLLFHMATGSGKTVVLAATILYLFKEQGKQNFIFFVNSDAIIKKTYDNLTNVTSSKYLFKRSGIVLDGQRISIQVVELFPAIPDPNTIYLKLTTIQKLHMDLTEPKENSLTFEALEEKELVLLADEAHHINAWTKRDKRTLNREEQLERTWENTVSRLLKSHSKNRLLEFTATIDLTKTELFEKYKEKIVYQYDLKRFMEDGYSKNVMLLRANESDETKMLHGILLSQYRKYVAKDHDIEMKPVILFKSNTIKVSLAAHESLKAMLDSITVKQLESIIETGYTMYIEEQSIWSKMFEYYRGKNLVDVIRDLRWDFAPGNILNANAKDFLSEDNALLLNSLEDLNNPIRAIFAVARLNEGWDVLNLFDIVRISEGASKTKHTTDSEAQLIGRGARYFPFVFQNEKSFTRRFDRTPSDLKVLEALHYHTINDNAYIRNLEKSLQAANIQVKEETFNRIEAKVKASFKKHPIFQSGKIYVNKLVPTTVADYDELKKYDVHTEYEITYERAIEQQFGESKQDSLNHETHTITWKVDRVFIQKAIQRNPFFYFQQLKQYVPAITSMKTFIESPKFLGDLTFHITLPKQMEIIDIAPREKLHMVEQFFRDMEKQIRRNYLKEKGTPVFEGVAFSKLIDNYYIELNKINARISQLDDVVEARNMRDHHWYIYDKAIVNKLENSFIDFIYDFITDLEEKYEEVFLIRNERKVKVVEIGGMRGFMPDFLLYLQKENTTYQVFLEPKGDHLRQHDQWKEEFLMSLSKRKDVEVLSENETVRLLGIKFYSDTPQYKSEFRKDFVEKIIEGN